MKEDLSGKSIVREYVEAIVVAVILALFIRTFVVQAFKIPSGSMLPTLQIGDHLLVNKFIYGIKIPFSGKTLIPISHPDRGDVVVFRFPKDPSVDYIKRVVGIAGDTVEVKDKVVYVNGVPAIEPHAHTTDPTILPGHQSPRDNVGPLIVPEDSIFVMGDNRDNSYDSRFWGFVNDKAILGKAFILYWSWDIKASLFSAERWMSIKWNRIANIVR